MEKSTEFPVIRVRFYDHCHTVGGKAKPLVCEVVGFLIDEDETSLYLASWLTEDGVDDNTDSYAILKSTITHQAPY